MKKHIISLVILSIFMFACGEPNTEDVKEALPPKEEQVEEDTQPELVEESAPEYGQAPKVVQTTFVPKAGKPSPLQKAELLVNCPTEMKEDEMYSVIACLYNAELHDSIIQHVIQSRDANDTQTKTVFVTKNYFISLIFDNEDFELIGCESEQKSARQKEGNIHQWQLKPLRPGKDKILMVKIENIDSKGNKIQSGLNRSISVHVAVNGGNFLSNIWVFLTDNPEYALSSIIIPIITFIVGLIRGRRKEKKSSIPKQTIDLD